MQKAHGKQAARGQRQIHNENQSTIFQYSLVSVISAVLRLSLNFFFEATVGIWIGWCFSSTLQLLAIGFMWSMIKTVRNERNQIIDAGMDLNDPQAFGEYCKDTVILCCSAHLLSIFFTYSYWLLICLPAFAFYKLWTKLLGPWFFAPSCENDDVHNDKKQKKREKKIFIRR